MTTYLHSTACIAEGDSAPAKALLHLLGNDTIGLPAMDARLWTPRVQERALTRQLYLRHRQEFLLVATEYTLYSRTDSREQLIRDGINLLSDILYRDERCSVMTEDDDIAPNRGVETL